MRVLNTDGRVLFNAAGHTSLYEGNTCRIPEISVERRLPIADWRAAVVEHAIAVAKEIFLRFNWREPNEMQIRDIVQRMFARQW